MGHSTAAAAADTGMDRRWAAITAERGRLLQLARARVPDEADAEDCAHEAMVRAMEFADLDESRLPQFLTTVTIRLCADHYRGEARRGRAGRRVALRETADPGPEEVVCDRSEAEWLASHVETLPPVQRDALRLRAAGLSGLGVAERLALPDTTVESALARARRSLRRVLEGSFGLAPWGRRLLLGGGAAAASAAVVLGVPGMTGGAPAPAPGPAAVAPPAAGVPAAAPAAGTGTAVRSGSGAGAPVADVPDRLPPRAGRPQRPPGEPVYGGGVAGPGGVAANVEQRDPAARAYTPAERAGHCVEYGVHVAPRTDCGYPPGDPRNDRFPDDGVVVHPPKPEAR